MRPLPSAAHAVTTATAAAPTLPGRRRSGHDETGTSGRPGSRPPPALPGPGCPVRLDHRKLRPSPHHGSGRVPPVPTIFTKGDLLHTDGVHAYAHGCNCAGTMDAGVSVAFKKRWPQMLEAYAQRCAERRPKLG